MRNPPPASSTNAHPLPAPPTRSIAAPAAWVIMAHEPDAVGAQALARIGDELDGAGTDLVDRLGRLNRRGAPIDPIFSRPAAHPLRPDFDYI